VDRPRHLAAVSCPQEFALPARSLRLGSRFYRNAPFDFLKKGSGRLGSYFLRSDGLIDARAPSPVELLSMRSDFHKPLGPPPHSARFGLGIFKSASGVING